VSGQTPTLLGSGANLPVGRPKLKPHTQLTAGKKRMTLLGTLISTVFNRNQANTAYRQPHNDWGNGEYQHLKRGKRQKQHKCMQNCLRAASDGK